MKLYIKKISKTSFVFYKESLITSILSDMITILAVLFAFAADYILTKLIGHSWLFDLIPFIMFMVYLSAISKKRMRQVHSKQQTENILTEILEAETK
jgi:membrane protein implicated in regulation of membrane protease activity